MEVKNSIITLTDRNSLVITGVEKVDTALENSIIAIVAGSKTNITGTNLFVQRLDIQNHLLEVIGNIDGIKFASKKAPFLKRILK